MIWDWSVFEDQKSADWWVDNDLLRRRGSGYRGSWKLPAIDNVCGGIGVIDGTRVRGMLKNLKLWNWNSETQDCANLNKYYGGKGEVKLSIREQKFTINYLLASRRISSKLARYYSSQRLMVNTCSPDSSVRKSCYHRSSLRRSICKW